MGTATSALRGTTTTSSTLSGTTAGTDASAAGLFGLQQDGTSDTHVIIVVVVVVVALAVILSGIGSFFLVRHVCKRKKGSMMSQSVMPEPSKKKGSRHFQIKVLK